MTCEAGALASHYAPSWPTRRPMGTSWVLRPGGRRRRSAPGCPSWGPTSRWRLLRKPFPQMRFISDPDGLPIKVTEHARQLY